MKGKIRGAFHHLRERIRGLTRGSREYLSGELDKVKRFSKLLAREILALFVLAIVAGIALSSLIQSFVFDLLMPFLGLVSPGGDWRKLRLRIGPTEFPVGNFLANLLFFLVVALIVLLVVKLMPRRPDIALPELVKKCPACGEPLLPGAVECDSCGQTLLDGPEEKEGMG